MGGSHPRVLTVSPKELVYVTLGRAEAKGYITSELDAPPSGTGGLPRRIYAGTTLGHRMFLAWTSGAKQLVPELGR